MHGLRRRNAPTFVDLERNDAPYVPPVCTFVYSFFVTKVRYVTARTRAPACEACTRVSPLSLSLFYSLRISSPVSLVSPCSLLFPKVCVNRMLTYVRTASSCTYVRTYARALRNTGEEHADGRATGDDTFFGENSEIRECPLYGGSPAQPTFQMIERS